MMIDVEQKVEKTKIGTGSGRRASAPAAVVTCRRHREAAESQNQAVVRLTLLGETVSEFENQVPIPGLMFSWGPLASGAIAYTDREPGHLMLLDQHKHKQTVNGVKDALLPAWSTDGARLAWAQKAGRKKYALVWASCRS